MLEKDYSHIFLSPEDSLREAIRVIDVAAIQIALVVDSDRRLLGTVTDGDIRRGILKGINLEETVGQVMNPNPITAVSGTSSDELMVLMASHAVKQVPLLDIDGRVVGLDRLEQLLQGPTIKMNPVIILAGGQGNRLRPLTENTPKPLLTVGGYPIMELILKQLRGNGFREFFISVNYLGEQIQEYLGDGDRYGINIQYLEESEQLGTAGPLSLLPDISNLAHIVINGDLLTRVNFEQMLEFHLESLGQFTIGVKDHSMQLPFGVVLTDEEQVLEFKEKPEQSWLINAGVYVMDPEIVRLVPKDSYYDMNRLINDVISDTNKQVNAFLIHEYWRDIGSVPDYRQAQWDYPIHFHQDI